MSDLTDDNKSNIEIIEKIEDLVKRYKHVSFVELKKHIGDRFNGNCEIELTKWKNCILWTGVSSEFADSLYECLYNRKTIETKPTDTLVYLIDGIMLKLPIAKRGPKDKKQYKDKHWLPVVFNPIGYKSKKRKTI